MSEQILRCPGCGAPAAADAASCSYCGAALATTTCAACFGPMFVGAHFCAHCGAVAARELLDEATPLPCPRCRQPMQALRLGATTVRECSSCGGVWLDPASLQRLADGREEHAAVVSVLGGRLAPAVASVETVRYLPCPTCAKMMNRVNFARSSGVILDVCKTHGIWLDRGELQRVLEFIDGGGLAAARDRKHAQLVEEQRRLAALGGPAMPSIDHERTAFTYHDGSTGGVGATGSLARLLRDALDALGG